MTDNEWLARLTGRPESDFTPQRNDAEDLFRETRSPITSVDDAVKHLSDRIASLQAREARREQRAAEQSNSPLAVALREATAALLAKGRRQRGRTGPAAESRRSRPARRAVRLSESCTIDGGMCCCRHCVGS